MALIETIIFIIGIIYGYLRPGKENRSALFRDGLIIGIILALILVGLGILAGGGLIFIAGGIAVFIEVIILTVLFIIGTWIGDWLEGRSKARTARITH